MLAISWRVALTRCHWLGINSHRPHVVFNIKDKEYHRLRFIKRSSLDDRDSLYSISLIYLYENQCTLTTCACRKARDNVFISIILLSIIAFGCQPFSHRFVSAERYISFGYIFCLAVMMITVCKFFSHNYSSLPTFQGTYHVKMYYFLIADCLIR